MCLHSSAIETTSSGPVQNDVGGETVDNGTKYYGCDEAGQNSHSSNANSDFQNLSNANANSGIYFISGKSECSALV